MAKVSRNATIDHKSDNIHYVKYRERRRGLPLTAAAPGSAPRPPARQRRQEVHADDVDRVVAARYGRRSRCARSARASAAPARPRSTMAVPLAVSTMHAEAAARRDAGALGGRAADRGDGGAAVDQEAHRPAVELAIDPEMAVLGHGGCAVRRPGPPGRPPPVASPRSGRPSARKSSLSAKTAKPAAKISTQASTILSVWPSGSRRTAKPLRDQERGSQKDKRN